MTGFEPVSGQNAQEILGHADIRTTLAIYTHTMRRRHDDSADKKAALAGLSSVGNKQETNGSVKDEETELSDCFDGSPGWNLSGAQAIEIFDVFRRLSCVVPPKVPTSAMRWREQERNFESVHEMAALRANEAICDPAVPAAALAGQVLGTPTRFD